MITMKKYVFASRSLFAASVVLAVINCTMATFFSLILGKIVDSVSGDMSQLTNILVIGLIFTVTYILIMILAGITKNLFIGKSRAAIKNDLFKAVLNSLGNDNSGINTSEYINDMTNNLSIYENSYLGNLFNVISLVTMFVSASIVTIMVEPIMLAFMIILAVITAWVSANIGKPIEKKTSAYIGSQSEYVAELKDDFSAFYIIKAFGAVKHILKKHNLKNKSMEDAKVSVGISQIMCQGIGQLVGLLSTVCVMAMAAYFVMKGRFSVGMIIAFGNLIGQIISPITEIPDVLANHGTAKPVLTRFKELLAFAENDEGVNKGSFDDEVDLDNVCFSYEDKQVLNKVSFKFKKGGKYAIVGTNGSGKTTLIGIIAGMIKSFDGDVKYDGITIGDISRESMTKLVGVVPQETFLFNDTIKNNISLFDEKYDDDSIRKALKRAGLDGLINKLPNGIDTVVEENGRNFSGGERQRLSIARAFLRECPILLLDEGTSAVDVEAAKDIEDELMNDLDLTLIEITHDISAKHIDRFDAVLRV